MMNNTNSANKDAIRSAPVYVYVAAAFTLLAVIAVCITVGLFFGVAWGMAAFTLLCVAAAAGAILLAREKVREARKVGGA